MQQTHTFPEPGDTVADRYIIESHLGAGASSRVYAARQSRLDRRVALKLIAIPPAPDTNAYRRWAARFERGAQILSKLTNPHVVDIYDFGETEHGQLYMAMELVEGRTLAHKIEASPMTEEEAAHLGIKLLEALAEAHEHGILHRDIKPANIMLTEGGEVRLLDFGVAKSIGDRDDDAGADLTQEGVFVGTPRYAAPEYLLGGTLGPWCDIYSLGLVLFEAVVGSPVVEASDTQTALRQHMIPKAFDLSSKGDVTDRFVQLIAAMIDKDPGERISSAHDAIATLRAFLDGEPLGAKDTVQTSVPSLDPNMDRPSDFFVNTPDALSSESGRPIEDEAVQASDSRPGISGGFASNPGAARQPSPRTQQERASADLALDTQSIAQPHDAESPQASSKTVAKSENAESEPVPAHIEQMLARGERRADRWHRLKWVGVIGLLAVVGGSVAMLVFAPPAWLTAVGLDNARDWGVRTLVYPVRDRVAPEHAEVSAQGIFEVVKRSGWAPASERGEIQTDQLHGWTQDFSLDDATVRIHVYRFGDRATAREQYEEVSAPNRAVRFARRLVIIKPIDAPNEDDIDGLQMMLKQYREMVDEAAG